MPKVSVIIPVYNVEKYLRECLDSVVNQTLKDIEIICINDGSPDNSLAILEEYAKKDNRIIVISQKNSGVSTARNIGIDLAKGEYIYFIDADDYAEPDLLELSYQKALSTQCDIVNFGFFEHYCNNLSKEGYANNIADEYDNNEFLSPEIVSKIFHCIWDKFYKKDFINRNSIRFPVGIKNCEDGNFNMQCLLSNANWVVLSNKLYHYRTYRAESAINNKEEIIKNEIDNLKCFISTKKFKETTLEYKIICLNKMIDAIIIYFRRYSSIKCLIKNFLQIFNLKKYLDKNLEYNLLINCKSYRSLKKILFGDFILKNIFTIRNGLSGNKVLKIVTVLGFKIKLEKKSKKQLKRILKTKIKNNSILIIEANNCHNETIPGFVRYFYELGFNVDILITSKMFSQNVFKCLDKKYYNNIFHLDINGIQNFLESEKPSEYDLIFINSNRLYYSGTRVNPVKFFDFFHHVTSPKKGFIKLEHHLEYLKEERAEENRVLQLPNFNNGALFCNSNFYGENTKHAKNNITNFIAVGDFKNYRRNVIFLFEAVEKLQKNNITKFKVTILSRKFTHKIPDNIKQFFDIKQNLPFNKLFEEIKTADFFLTCLDPCNEEHNRYMTTGTSGSFQLIYGFNIPCLIENKFAMHHYFNETNSIIYNGNYNLVNALQQCIEMDNVKYQEIKQELNKTVLEIRQKSLNNLKKSVNSIPYKVISLGYDCLPRTYTVNSNIKPKKNQGECSMPFDLCVTPTKSLYQIIKNDFNDYLNNLKYSKKKALWVNKRYNIIYNHDLDCKNSIKGKNKLKKRLKSRILNFQNALNYDGMLYFIINRPANEDLINNIHIEIKNKRENKPFKIIALDIDANLNENILNKEIILFNKKHPFPQASDWWKEEYVEQNLKYQEEVSDFISHSISSFENKKHKFLE